MSTTITYTPASHAGMSCEVRSPMGLRLTVSGTLDDVEPTVAGDDLMRANKAIVHNAWAWARHEKLFRRVKSDDKKASHRKQADEHAKVIKELGPLVEAPGDSMKRGYCSGCFALADHFGVKSSATRVPTYLCENCGTPTLPCAAPGCPYMAIRKPGAVRIPRFCAEHRHEIPSFERATERVDDIADWEQLNEFDEKNYSRLSKVAVAVGAGAGIIATGGMLAAPAIGGAIGSLAGYSGAAATSYGLALLGGGAASSGALAFGMVGGTYVVTAAGAALGGAMGSIITNAYVGEDESFRIEKFRDGTGTPVIIARGFMTETDRSWASAVKAVETRYPDAPIYRLHWGSKELKALAKFALPNIIAQPAAAGFGGLVARASKAAAGKVPFAAPVVVGAQVAKNPWHTAIVRADRTGVALAGVIARTNVEKYILVGHSLGARVVITATETLGTSPDSPQIEALHVLGAAEGVKGDWRPLNDAVVDKVHNYFSKNDKVLKFAYQTAQAGSKPLGLYGFGSSFAKIKDHDVSAKVNGHSEYFDNVRLS